MSLERLGDFVIRRVEYSRNKIFKQRDVEVWLDTKYKSGKAAYMNASLDFFEKGKNFKKVFSKHKGLFMKLKPLAKDALMTQEKMRRIYDKHDTCKNCKTHSCCFIQCGDIDGYLYEPDLILFKLNNKKIPNPRPVLVSTDEKKYLGCGFISSKGCTLGELRPLTCVNSECKTLKASLDPMDKIELDMFRTKLMKMEYNLDSIWKDLTEDSFVVPDKMLRMINRDILLDNDIVYEGKGKFNVFSKKIEGGFVYCRF